MKHRTIIIGSVVAIAGVTLVWLAIVQLKHPFGPVIERKLSGSEALSDCFLDLDSGRLLSAPQELVESLRKRGRLNGGSPDIDLLREWMRSSGVDLVKRTGKTWSLVKLDGVCTKLPEEADGTSHADAFDNVSVAPVIRALKSAEAEQGGLALAANLVSRLSHQGARLFAFKTRKGGMGVLQVTGESDDPPSVTLRYKLIRRWIPPLTMPWERHPRRIDAPPNYRAGVDAGGPSPFASEHSGPGATHRGC